MLQHNAQRCHLSAHGPSVFVMRYVVGIINFTLQTRFTFPFLGISSPITVRPDSQECFVVGRSQFSGFTSATLADCAPAKYRANRFIRVHEAFVGCFISFAQASVSNCSSQRLIDCQAPNNSTEESALLSRSTSSSGFMFDGCARRRCWFAIRQFHAVQHCSQVSLGWV